MTIARTQPAHLPGGVALTSTVLRPQLRRLPGLQLLRGAAAASVVAFHANLFFGDANTIAGSQLGRLFTFGHAGVDLFFVLSGFIIVHAHWHDQPTWAAVGRYCFRRIIRIYPMTALTVLGLLAIIPALRAWTGDPLFFPIESRQVLASIALVPLTCGYLPGVLWSLQDEIYFYLLFLTFYINRYLFLWLVCAWAVIATANSALKIIPTLSDCGNYVFGVYNGLFACGVGAFLLWRMLEHRKLAGLHGALIAAGAALFILSATIDVIYVGPVYFLGAGAPPYPVTVKALTRLLYASGATLLITGAALWRWTPHTPISRGAILLGDASFAIYLTHLPVLGLLARLLKVTPPNEPAKAIVLFFIMMAASLITGVFVHLSIEKPMLKVLRSFQLSV